MSVARHDPEVAIKVGAVPVETVVRKHFAQNSVAKTSP